MNLQSMEYMIVTADERSITKAAERLNITQQSLSAHIAGLEQELGCQLFVRHVPLEITYAGKEFLRYAQAIQHQVKELKRTFHEISGEETGVLKIGVTHTRGNLLLPSVIMEFQKKYPYVDLNIVENTNDVLVQKLKLGEIDICISDFSGSHVKWQQIPLYRERVVFVIKKELFYSLYREKAETVLRKIQEEADYSLLEKCPLLMSHKQDISGKYVRKITETFENYPVVKAEASNMELLLRLCANGLGGCFCPEIIVKHVLSKEQLEQVFLISLRKEAEYTMYIGWKDDWKVISAFVETAREQSRAGEL